MKQIFKSLGIASAVAAAAAGYSTISNAQDISSTELGDLALVPYYTVLDSWSTGVHVINTSDQTQVVKFRLRRAKDSLDALDFNVILSPFDVYAGEVIDDASGDIYFATYGDTTCTAPAAIDGKFKMPDIYREGADTGYIEVIAMGAPSTEDGPIATAAKHTVVDGVDVPRDCTAVRSNFFSGGTSEADFGNELSTTTWQAASSNTGVAADDGVGAPGQNTFVDSGNVLKVSYYVRDTATGIEFGDNAVHIEDFLAVPAMTNQELGYLSGDLTGFDFPDLNGGAPLDVASRGAFATLRTNLGNNNIINEWSANPENGVALNWIVTMPGQYTMLDRPRYLIDEGSDDAADDCDAGATLAVASVGDCDFRDLPVTAEFANTVFNREERGLTVASGDLVVSPAIPGEASRTVLSKEVNVISFGDNLVFSAADNDITADLGQPFGWLSMGVTSQTAGIQAVCEWDIPGGTPPLTVTCSDAGIVADQVPMIGFAAWVRSVNDNPDASYGRAIRHSQAAP